MRKWHIDGTRRNKRCGHTYCGECGKKRGRNRGNRDLRRTIRTRLRKFKAEDGNE